ncbi:MAG: pyridoxal-phosphate dependent enzyme [Anaerolineae bacterium]
MPADIGARKCAHCGSPWLDARYDYAAVAPLWTSAVASRGRSLWRYAELLPLNDPDADISMSEGYTPLLRLHQYERLYEHEGLYVKDERHNPTNSFKDRQAALSVMAMRRAGVGECVLASTGNAAVAYAAYCARAGIKLWLFMTHLVPNEKMRECALYGAEVVKVSGTYDEAKEVAAQFAKRKGLWLDGGAKSIPGKESMKTLAYEMAEQFAMSSGGQGHWRSPDWYIQAVSGGIGPLGVWKGFSELLEMGMIDKMPKIAVVQAAGCAPMVQAFHAGKAKADPVVPKTLVHVLATGDPGFSYSQLREMALSNGGTMLAIEDSDTFEAMRRLASKAGLSVEPAAAVAFAGLERMLLDGTIAPDESVIVNCSGHTFPAESHVLGDHYVHDLELSLEAENGGVVKTSTDASFNVALQSLDEQVTTILVVDDTPNDRRLIRRLLQRYKRYRMIEARSGAEALQLVRDHRPDLVVADLTMPGLDGFSFLEAIKSNPETAEIPVVVVSAKSLTREDWDFLGTHAHSVWQKGGFDTQLLVDHVVRTLGHSPVASMKQERAKGQLAEPSAAPATLSRILVIDDNPQDLRLTSRIIKSAGTYQVIEAASGRDGLKAIHEYRPDLIVLDLILPDLDGFSILHMLKNDEKLCDIPVIVLSGKELTEVESDELKPYIRLRVEKSTLDRIEFLSIIKNELI